MGRKGRAWRGIGRVLFIWGFRFGACRKIGVGFDRVVVDSFLACCLWTFGKCMCTVLYIHLMTDSSFFFFVPIDIFV